MADVLTPDTIQAATEDALRRPLEALAAARGTAVRYVAFGEGYHLCRVEWIERGQMVGAEGRGSTPGAAAMSAMAVLRRNGMV